MPSHRDIAKEMFEALGFQVVDVDNSESEKTGLPPYSGRAARIARQFNTMSVAGADQTPLESKGKTE